MNIVFVSESKPDLDMESQYDLTYVQKLRTIVIKVKWLLSLTEQDVRNLRNGESTDAHIKQIISGALQQSVYT